MIGAKLGPYEITAKLGEGGMGVVIGSEAVIKEGAGYDVQRAGEVIKDPGTGEVLGANETKVGRIKITEVRGPRLSTAIALSGSG